MQREAWNMDAEMDNGKQHHGNGAAGGGGNGRSLDAQLRTAPMAEDEGVVANNVQHVDNACDNHRIDDLVGTAQRG